MYKKLISIIIFSLMRFSAAYADCLACSSGLIDPGDEFPTIWTKVIMLSGGPGWTKAGDFQQQYTSPLLFNAYVPEEEYNTLGEGEIFFALQHSLTSYLYGRFGIAAAGSSPANLQGTVYLNSDPDLRAYTYRYQVAHGRVTFKSMFLLGAENQRFLPYMMGSVGLAFNVSHQYKQTPTSNLFPVVPTFRTQTDYGFVYTVGGGLETAFTKHWHGGVGYQFANWGKSHLDSVAGQPFDEGLRLTRLYTHLLQFSLTYIC